MDGNVGDGVCVPLCEPVQGSVRLKSVSVQELGSGRGGWFL